LSCDGGMCGRELACGEISSMNAKTGIKSIEAELEVVSIDVILAHDGIPKDSDRRERNNQAQRRPLDIDRNSAWDSWTRSKEARLL
jgi:hypothetical protein